MTDHITSLLGNTNKWDLGLHNEEDNMLDLFLHLVISLDCFKTLEFLTDQAVRHKDAGIPMCGHYIFRDNIVLWGSLLLMFGTKDETTSACHVAERDLPDMISFLNTVICLYERRANDD